MSTINTLPKDVWLTICNYLDVSSLSKVFALSKHFLETIMSTPHWNLRGNALCLSKSKFECWSSFFIKIYPISCRFEFECNDEKKINFYFEQYQQLFLNLLRKQGMHGRFEVRGKRKEDELGKRFEWSILQTQKPLQEYTTPAKVTFIGTVKKTLIVNPKKSQNENTDFSSFGIFKELKLKNVPPQICDNIQTITHLSMLSLCLHDVSNTIKKN